MSSSGPPSPAQLGAAFGLTLAASAGCLLGGSVVFVSSVVRKVDKLFLAAALALSAGVMLMVSLTEVYGESLHEFGEAGHVKGEAALCASGALFGGFALVVLLDHFLHGLDDSGGGACRCCCLGRPEHTLFGAADEASGNATPPPQTQPQPLVLLSPKTQVQPHKLKPSLLQSQAQAQAPQNATRAGRVLAASGAGVAADGVVVAFAVPGRVGPLDAPSAAAADARLKQLGLLASVAIVLHSVPEGLGTFVAAVSGSEAGFVVAIALAVHKLFEGVIVAVPQFYGTGSRWRAFAWAAVAAAANPIGGLFGLLAVYRGMPSHDVFGVTYGMVAGLMAWIALGELLPSAREHDPEDRVTSRWLAAGMALMAATLVLLAYTGAP